jgi:hypothetical protein
MLGCFDEADINTASDFPFDKVYFDTICKEVIGYSRLISTRSVHIHIPTISKKMCSLILIFVFISE